MLFRNAYPRSQSVRKHGLFHTSYFENGPLEPGLILFLAAGLALSDFCEGCCEMRWREDLEQKDTKAFCASRENVTPMLRGMINRFWEKAMTVQFAVNVLSSSVLFAPYLLSFFVTRTRKGCSGHDFIPDRAWEMLRENFLVYVRFELFLNNFWNSSTILLCFVFIRVLFEY